MTLETELKEEAAPLPDEESGNDNKLMNDADDFEEEKPLLETDTTLNDVADTWARKWIGRIYEQISCMVQVLDSHQPCH